MNPTTAVTGLVLLCATALPAQGERKTEAPPKAQKKVDKPDAAALRAAELQRVVENLGRIRTAQEKARDVDRLEVLAQAQRALAERVRKQAILVEKELVVPRINEGVLRALLAAQPGAQPSPLMKGDYQKAVEKLEAAQRAMRTAPDPEAAMRAIDEASKALMEARAAAWKQKEAKSEKKSEAKKQDG